MIFIISTVHIGGDHRIDLGQGYIFHYTSSTGIFITRPKVDHYAPTAIIESIVVAYKNTDNWLYVLRQPTENFLVNENDPKNIYLDYRILNTCEYWILDKVNGAIMGPFTLTEFGQKLISLSHMPVKFETPVYDNVSRYCIDIKNQQ
jgi:hypothetical protein